MKKEKSTWKKVRGLFNDLHLWMGIASGIILFLVCLSGTIYTFSTEIQQFTDSEKYTVQASADQTPLPLEELIDKTLDSLKGSVVQSVTIPSDRAQAYQFSINKKEESGGRPERGNGSHEKPSKGKGEFAADASHGKKKDELKQGGEGGKKPEGGRRGRGTTYLIDPYTAEIKGTTQSTTSEFFMVMFRMHRWLLLDMEIGRPIVGIATIIFTLIILTGMVIWFPQKIKNWRQGLIIKTSGNWKRINHDLHNSLGFYSSFLLLIMALTGLTWSFEWYKTGFNNALGVDHSKEKKEEPVSSLPADLATFAKPSLADFVTAANETLPYKGDLRLSLPSDSTGTVSITKIKTGFFAYSGSDKVILDQYSAKVLKIEIFTDKPVNEQIASSIKALHIGSIYGTFSKILYFIACLIATSLPVTGTIIWINKLKKKGKKKKEKSPNTKKQSRKVEVTV